MSDATSTISSLAFPAVKEDINSPIMVSLMRKVNAIYFAVQNAKPRAKAVYDQLPAKEKKIVRENPLAAEKLIHECIATEIRKSLAEIDRFADVITAELRAEILAEPEPVLAVNPRKTD